jgi:hypothetical protein
VFYGPTAFCFLNLSVIEHVASFLVSTVVVNVGPLVVIVVLVVVVVVGMNSVIKGDILSDARLYTEPNNAFHEN